MPDEPFVRNVATAPAFSHPHRATFVALEPEGVHWPDTGVNVQILVPGQPNCRYHSEPAQEDFLVLHGECLAIIDGEEHALRAWDFVHCPADTPHVFVGRGEEPCAILMIGSRRVEAAHYPSDALAARHGASVERDTDDPAEAYADWRRTPFRPTSIRWPPP